MSTKTKNSYYTYLLLCSDSTYYCGITNNLEKRVKAHNTNKIGAKYTRARRPVRLVYSEKFKTRSLAQIREAQIKKLSRLAKESLILSL